MPLSRRATARAHTESPLSLLKIQVVQRRDPAEGQGVPTYPRALPWSDQVVDLIDELAAERLPDRLTEARRQERAKQREAEAERERLQVSVDERLTRADELSAEQRAELAADAGRAYGPYAPEAWKVRERINQLDRTEADPEPAE